MKRLISLALILAGCLTMTAQQVNIITSKKASQRELYAKEYLTKQLTALGYQVTSKKGTRITLSNAAKGPAEGYTITPDKKAVSTGFQDITISGNDATGVIYGCVELAERIKMAGTLEGVQPTTDAPQMVMRGTCIGLQKPVYLPEEAEMLARTLMSLEDGLKIR